MASYLLSIRRHGTTLGLVSGAVMGLLLVAIAGPAVAERRPAELGDPLLEATHLPPLLTLPGEQVELRYETYCIDRDVDDPEGSCTVTGSVFVRQGERGPFRQVPLERTLTGGSGELTARIPSVISSWPDGFTYYAVLEASTGAVLTLPAGGASAPQRSLPLDHPVAVHLGRHHFGIQARADERVVELAWGSDRDDAGLEDGSGLMPIGASSFDVDEKGTILVLDQAHRRVFRWRDRSSRPESLPVSVVGTVADLALAPDGSFFVLESVGTAGRAPLVRRFDQRGRQLDAVETAERGSQIRSGPTGPLVLQHPASQWMAVTAGGALLAPASQRRLGRSGRPLAGGGEVIVLRRPGEILVALLEQGGVLRSWHITSSTPLAEVQLAEPLGRRLVIVVRAYTEIQDEFAVLVLDDHGLQRRLSLGSAGWAETAPLGRFRLVGRSLFQLGSTPAGAFVDRFDLEAG